MFTGPDIVTDGLVLALDAANVKSYPGSGTTWKDIVGNCDLTAFNTPTFSTDNSGVFVFDGSSDYFRATTNVPSLGTNPRTVIAWLNADASIYGCMFGFGDIPTSSGGGGNSFELWNYNITNGLRIHITAGSYGVSGNFNLADNLNKWLMISLHYAGSDTGALALRIVDNGTIRVGTYTNTNLDTFTNNLSINKSAYGSEDGGMTGKFGTFLVYNKDLTEAEVLQNYNATKTRFGL